jgi:multidrug resistance efflux pump
MSTSFTRTVRALEADAFRRTILVLCVAALLLAAWGAWFLLAPVTRYEVTETARLEVDRAVYPVQSPLQGRVAATILELDAKVKAGAVLVELESTAERLQMEEERARIAAIEPQLRALEAEIAASRQALQNEQQATAAALNEARARVEEVESVARHAESEARRLSRLHAEGLISARELDQGNAEAERRRAAVSAVKLVLARLESEQRTRETDRISQMERLHGEVSRLRGQRTTSLAALERLGHEIERRRIRAPVSGRLGEVATLRTGAVVAEGEKLGAIVPEGTLRAVAEFAPPAALGRVRPGQPARLRLNGFPWGQYGSIPARVTNVAGEVRQGTVRVELAVAEGQETPIPLQHGLPGSVEVEVERVTPATLVIRTAGQLLTAPRTAVDSP